MSFFQNLTKRKSSNKITFCDPKTPLAKQNELKEHINNKRTKLNTQENIPSDTSLITDPNLMDTETIVAPTSNVANVENNAEGSSSSTDKQKSAVNWADDADMNLDNNILASGGDFENTLLTLNPPAAEDANKHQSNSSIEKGKNVDNSPNKQDFIQIPRLTRIFTTAPAEKINGDKPEMMIINMQKLFAVTPGFLGAKHFSNKKSIAIYFDKEYNLKKAIEFDNKTNKLSVPCFTVANS